MAVKQKSFKIFTYTDGYEYSEAGSFGKGAKKQAEIHEKGIMLTQTRREFDVVVAKILGIKTEMAVDDPRLREEDWLWYDDVKGPWAGAGKIDIMLKKLDDDSHCPGDIEYTYQLVENIQTWVKALGGIENVKKLAALDTKDLD